MRADGVNATLPTTVNAVAKAIPATTKPGAQKAGFAANEQTAQITPSLIGAFGAPKRRSPILVNTSVLVNQAHDRRSS